MGYYLSTILHHDFNKVKEKVVVALKQEGLGILTKIDIRETLKKKLDVDEILSVTAD